MLDRIWQDGRSGVLNLGIANIGADVIPHLMRDPLVLEYEHYFT